MPTFLSLNLPQKDNSARASLLLSPNHLTKSRSSSQQSLTERYPLPVQTDRVPGMIQTLNLWYLLQRSYPIQRKRRDGLKAAPWQNFPNQTKKSILPKKTRTRGGDLAPRFFRETPKFCPHKVPPTTVPTTRTEQTSTNLTTNPPKKQPDFFKNFGQSKVDPFTLTLRGDATSSSRWTPWHKSLQEHKLY